MIGLNFSVEEVPCGVVLSAGELFAPDQESVDLLRHAGIPSYTAADLTEQPRLTRSLRAGCSTSRRSGS